MLWGMFLFFLHKTIITGGLSRKRRQGVETGQNHPEKQQFLNFAFCRTIYRPEIFLRLQGFPEANFNPKTYRKTNYHERRGFMPKMSQKRKKELSLFLNNSGRVEYNALCRRCVHECKQPHKAMVAECRRYLSKRSVEVMENG